MPIFLARMLRMARIRLRGWRLSVAIAGFVFLTSWLAMELVEPESNQITAPENYWWWFVVTSATVGYGDHFPESGLGHLVGAYVIVGGIVALTVLFTELAALIQNRKGRLLKGVVAVDMQGHTVLIGYTPGRTERIVDEFTVEKDLKLVVCAREDVHEHPMPERPGVKFVRGDVTSVEVLTRADVDRAATVVIDSGDDNETLTIAVAVDHVNPDVHLVAALQDMSRAEHLRYVNPKVQCVQWHMPKMITEEASDPGITQVYADLMTRGGTGNTYSVRLPGTLAGRSFGDCQTHFGRGFGATVLAVRCPDGRLEVSPAWDFDVPADAVLYYVATRRIEEDRLARTS